jgi:hypothetical protein
VDGYGVGMDTYLTASAMDLAKFYIFSVGKMLFRMSAKCFFSFETWPSLRLRPKKMAGFTVSNLFSNAGSDPSVTRILFRQ